MTTRGLIALGLVVIARLGGIALAIIAANDGLWVIAAISVLLAAATSYNIGDKA